MIHFNNLNLGKLCNLLNNTSLIVQKIVQCIFNKQENLWLLAKQNPEY